MTPLHQTSQTLISSRPGTAQSAGDAALLGPLAALMGTEDSIFHATIVGLEPHLHAHACLYYAWEGIMAQQKLGDKGSCSVVLASRRFRHHVLRLWSWQG